jgi:hypothetical protein
MTRFAVGVGNMVKVDFSPICCYVAIGALPRPVAGGRLVTALTIIEFTVRIINIFPQRGGVTG